MSWWACVQRAGVADERIPKTIRYVFEGVCLSTGHLVATRSASIFAWWLVGPDCQSTTWKGWSWKMKITPYQANAKMLQEAQRVIHQKNLQELQRLNHQKEQQIQQQKWARPNSVDVYAWNICYLFFFWLDVKTATGTSAKTLITLFTLIARSLSVCLRKHALNI